jgi:hypothetical protein
MIQGTSGNDTITGTAGDDVIIGSLGTDTVDGGAGFDVLRFSGLPATYFWSGSVNVSDTDLQLVLVELGRLDPEGSGSVTTFTGIERIEFLDATVELSGTSLAAQVGNLFQGLLGREVDIPALAFWTHQATEAGIASVTAALLGSAEFAVTSAGLGQDQVFARLYREVLGREGGSGEISFWTGAAQQIGMTAAVTSIVTSAEAASDPLGRMGQGLPVFDADAAWIGHSFDGLLGRNPDLGGYTAFLEQMRAGQDERAVVDAIVGSPEFAQRTGVLDDAGFVQALYRDVLGREADAGGEAFHLAALGGGVSRADLAFSFLTSAEANPHYQALLGWGVELA